MTDNTHRPKGIRVTFPDDTNELSIPHANAIFVQSGIDDFFVTVGVARPPEITSVEDFGKFEVIPAKALFRFGLSRLSMKQFIDVLQNQYDIQTKALEAADDDEDEE